MRKNIIALLCVILLAAIVINGTEIQSVDEYYLTHIDDIKRQQDSNSEYPLRHYP